MKEIWKDIIGYEGLYQISNYGRIKSLCRKCSPNEFIMSTPINHYGYMIVHLRKRGHKKFFQVHRLVAISFVSNPNNYNYVNHKDENKANNKVDNLEWCTPKYNTNYGTCIQRRSSKQRNNHGSKSILQYTINHELVRIYPSIMEATRITDINPRAICSCCKGYQKTAYGYIWEYA